jgi:hypothetical protein
MAKLAFPNALDEITGMTKVVTDSDLDWTIARITNPTDKPSKGTLRGRLPWSRQGRFGDVTRRHCRVPRCAIKRHLAPESRSREQQLKSSTWVPTRFGCSR